MPARRNKTARRNERRLAVCLFHKDKSGAVIVLPVHPFGPHGGGANPKPLLTVKGAVDHHGLQSFRMLGNADELILISFEVTIFPG